MTVTVRTTSFFNRTWLGCDRSHS